VSSAIRFAGLTVRYGARTVFEKFDLRVDAGETVAILGASGCGKSTLLRAAAGLIRLDAGTVESTGELGFVFQEPRLMPWLTVERNVAFAARDDRERAHARDAIRMVGLADAAHVLPKALSGGMAQRAALARTLVRSPRILLLDEPLSALDALLRLELQSAVARIVRETASTAMLVTHDVDEALYLADRIVVLAGGPAGVILEVDVPGDARRSREADLTGERIRLLRALGVDDGAPVTAPRAPSPA
jgi:sulfonate transport system ATP-binding protein